MGAMGAGKTNGEKRMSQMGSALAEPGETPRETLRVLLTGHKGYLVTVMVPALVAAGAQVVGLDAELFAECLLGPEPDDPPGHVVDLRDVSSRHLSEVDAVVHLAALSNDPLGALAPDLTYDINHHASVSLAR